MKTSFLKKALSASLVLSVLAFSGPAAADMYSLTFQGVTFTINATDGDTQFTLRIEGAASTTDPDWDNANYLAALGFKSLGIDFSAAGVGATLTAVPAGSTAWDNLNAELNASGCSDTGAPDQALCFSGVPPLATTDDMTFTITITGGQTLTIGDNGPHLKVLFLSAFTTTCDDTGACTYSDYVKEGSLLSKDLPGTSVPEPGTLALLGIGLAGLGFSRRKKV